MAATYYKSQAIVITVGSITQQQSFTVHEDLLLRESEYFRIALKSQFIEGQSKTFCLAEDDPQAFDIFVQYLYTRSYTMPEKLFEGYSNPEEMWLETQAKAYLLGDKLIAMGFRTEIIRCLDDQLHKKPPSMHVLVRVAEEIYQNASATDAEAIKDVLSDHCAARMGHAWGLVTWPVWTRDDKTALVDTGLSEFIVDVFEKVVSLLSFFWLVCLRRYSWEPHTGRTTGTKIGTHRVCVGRVRGHRTAYSDMAAFHA